jgi:hypothetical protein
MSLEQIIDNTRSKEAHTPHHINHVRQSSNGLSRIRQCKQNASIPSSPDRVVPVVVHVPVPVPVPMNTMGQTSFGLPPFVFPGGATSTSHNFMNSGRPPYPFRPAGGQGFPYPQFTSMPYTSNFDPRLAYPSVMNFGHGFTPSPLGAQLFGNGAPKVSMTTQTSSATTLDTENNGRSGPLDSMLDSAYDDSSDRMPRFSVTSAPSLYDIQSQRRAQMMAQAASQRQRQRNANVTVRRSVPQSYNEETVSSPPRIEPDSTLSDRFESLRRF